jgi:hypothetical protein
MLTWPPTASASRLCPISSKAEDDHPCQTIRSSSCAHRSKHGTWLCNVHRVFLSCMMKLSLAPMLVGQSTSAQGDCTQPEFEWSDPAVGYRWCKYPTGHLCHNTHPRKRTCREWPLCQPLPLIQTFSSWWLTTTSCTRSHTTLQHPSLVLPPATQP